MLLRGAERLLPVLSDELMRKGKRRGSSVSSPLISISIIPPVVTALFASSWSAVVVRERREIELLLLDLGDGGASLLLIYKVGFNNL